MIDLREARKVLAEAEHFYEVSETVEAAFGAYNKEIIRLRSALNKIAHTPFGVMSEREYLARCQRLASDALAIGSPVCNQRAEDTP